MAIHHYHHGTRVSVAHAAILAAYERKYVRVRVNEGRRTLAEQAKFYAHYLRYGRPLAAKPYPGAPHIKWGKEHHALDIDSGPQAGRAGHVAEFYRSLGVPVAFNVSGEPWHMDVRDEAKLVKAAKRLGAVWEPTLRRGQTGQSIVKLKKLLYDKGYRNFSGENSSNRYNPFFSKYTEEAVKRFQRKNNLGADGIVGPGTWTKLKS
jgi:hypothetical protein